MQIANRKFYRRINGSPYFSLLRRWPGYQFSSYGSLPIRACTPRTYTRKSPCRIHEAWTKSQQFTYDSLSQMTYLDSVIAETLRKYPPASALFRECVQPYRVPGSDLELEPGTIVCVPVVGLHHDPAYYPEPDRFDPERFSDAGKAKRTPFTYLPFGEGPRACLGMRFGLLQIKIAVATFLLHFEATPSMLTEYPVRFAKGVMTATNEKCFVRINKLPRSKISSCFS